MVQAMININEHANRVLNIVKAKYGLRDKSEAINLVTMTYEEDELEPELRPEFIEDMKQAKKEKTIKVKNVSEYFEQLRKR